MANQRLNLRHVALVLLPLVSSFAVGGDGLASCEIADQSVVSRSSSGVAQVSNLGLIHIRCPVAARPWPLKPGESYSGLTAETTLYALSANSGRSLVPSEVNVSAGDSDRSGSKQQEWVVFYINIPLDPAERDAEISRYLVNLERGWADDQAPEEVHEHEQEQLRLLRKYSEILAPMVSQYRVGRYRVECRVLDGDRMMGVGRVGLEVLFKGVLTLDTSLRKIPQS